MLEFNEKYGKYITSLENPNYNVGQLLIRTAGKGGRRQTYHPPTSDVVKKTLALFAALENFDTSPSDDSFLKVQASLASLEMKAVQVKDSPEWIYITPNANVESKSKTEKAKWERISIKTQFNCSWHVGCKSKIAASDEHNGGDGCFRAVSEMVYQGADLKLVMSNSRHRRTSEIVGRRFVGDWAHSAATIDAPVMRYLGDKGFTVINVHGMASKLYGLMVNNWNSNFTKKKSYPTLLGIALAKRFPNKKFNFAGVIPGYIVVNGKKCPISPPNNANYAENAIFYRARGAHNTNYIGRNCINRTGDSGRSVHIEFGIIRDGRRDLRKMAAAIAEANFWSTNYIDSKHNPWQLEKNNPEIFNDMRRYSELFENPSAELMAILEQENSEAEVQADVIPPEDVTFEIDENPSEFLHEPDMDEGMANAEEESLPDSELTTDDDNTIDEVYAPSSVELLKQKLSEVTAFIEAAMLDINEARDEARELEKTIADLEAADTAAKAAMAKLESKVGATLAAINDAMQPNMQAKTLLLSGGPSASTAKVDNSKAVINSLAKMVL